MAARRRSNEKFVEIVKGKFGDKLIYDKTKYTGRRNNVIVTCPHHGDIVVNAGTLLKTRIWCKECSVTGTVEDFIERSRLVHGDKYSYHKVKWVNTTTKVEIICPDHGSFWIEPYMHYSKGQRCMGCYREANRSDNARFVRSAKKVHGDTYDYSEVRYIHNRQHVKIRCRTHGIFVQYPSVHLTGSGCTQCFIDRYRLPFDEFVRNAQLVHGTKYDYSRVNYGNNKDKVELICPNHGSFWVKPNSHVSNRAGCPRCKESKGETRIRTFLETHGLEFVQEYRIAPHRYRYDFYIPAHNLLVEFHGHQHYRPVKLFGGEVYFNETVKNDRRKAHIAKKEGYRLVTIKYTKLVKSRLEVFLERILRQNGHVFDDSKTIVSNNGPCRMGTFY